MSNFLQYNIDKELSIADRFRSEIPQLEKEIDSIETSDLSLYFGKMGRAILSYYTFKQTGNDNHLKKCHSLVDSVVEELPNKKGMNSSFCYGYSGVVWAIGFLAKKNILDIDNNYFNEVEDFIYTESLSMIRAGRYDLLHGGMGGALVAIQRKDKKSWKFIDEFVHELNIIKEVDELGIKWPDLIYQQIHNETESVYNLGLAHGIPSIIEILRLIYINFDRHEMARSLAKGALDWMFSKQIKDPKSLSIFPNRVYDSGTNKNPSFLRWCYGDLSIATVFYKSGITFDNNEWKSFGQRIMEHASERSELLITNKLELGICHGVFGVGYLFNKFYLLTGIDEFRKRSHFWFLKGLDKIGKEGGILNAIECTLDSEDNSNDKLYSFLEGMTGVGLVKSSILQSEYSWDECILL